MGLASDLKLEFLSSKNLILWKFLPHPLLSGTVGTLWKNLSCMFYVWWWKRTRERANSTQTELCEVRESNLWPWKRCLLQHDEHSTTLLLNWSDYSTVTSPNSLCFNVLKVQWLCGLRGHDEDWAALDCSPGGKYGLFWLERRSLLQEMHILTSNQQVLYIQRVFVLPREGRRQR